MQVSALFLCWGSYHLACNLWVFVIYLFFLPIILPSVVPRLATDLAARVLPGVWKLLPFLRLPSWDGAPSLPLLFSFCLLYFSLLPFEENGLLFWVPDVLCQHSEVVLWNLLSVQMFFWWILGRESGLPILFLCHLRTTSQFFNLVQPRKMGRWIVHIRIPKTLLKVIKGKWKSLSRVLLFATPWTVACRFLCPWNSPGKNTGLGCHSLLQGIFPTQWLISGLPHGRQILYQL